MQKWIGLCGVLFVGCTVSPGSVVSPTAPSSTAVITDAPAPKAAGDEAVPVIQHVRDRCNGGPLTSGANGGRDAYPITLTFTGPESFETQTNSSDYVAMLVPGHWTVRSVTSPATSGTSGYQPTTVSFDVPQQTEVAVNQIRDCGPIVPPPGPPPPVPPPPVPPPPGPPPCVETARADEPVWDRFDRTADVEASVLVHGPGTFKVAIFAASSGVAGYAREKASETVVVACGASQRLSARYDWTHHPFDQWWIVVWLDGVVVKVSPISVSVLP